MWTSEYTLSETALFEVFRMIGRCDVPLLEVCPGSAKAYLAACAQWERLGWGEPDFDGSFRPTPIFARIAYGMKGVKSAMRLSRAQGGVCLYLRSDVDVIRLRREGDDTWALSLRPLAEGVRVLGGEAADERDGELLVQDENGEQHSLSLSQTQPGRGERKAALCRQLTWFYPLYHGEEDSQA